MARHKFSKEIVKQLLGGEWPEVKGYEGFSWDAVAHFVLEDDTLHPSDGYDRFVGGPSIHVMLVALPNPHA